MVLFNRFLYVFLIFVSLFSFSSALPLLSPNNDTYTCDYDSEFNRYGSSPIDSDGILLNDSTSVGSYALLKNDVSNGSLNLNSDGSFEYLANVGFHGVDYFDYILTDSITNSSPARVYIGVNNSLVTPKNDIYTCDYDSEFNRYGSSPIKSDGVLLNDTLNGGLFDSEGDSIWTVLKNDVSNGSLNLNSDGSFEYLANVGFHGVDYFDYILTDGHLSKSARVYFGVNNSAPIAVEDRYYITNFINTTNVTGVLFNDNDLDNDSLSLSITENVNFGNLETTGTDFSSEGSFNYTANKTNGVDYFTYELTDHHLSSSAKCIFVIGNNSAPVALNDSYYTSLDKLNVSAALGVKSNDNDIDNDYLFAELVNTTTNGTLVLYSDGSFIYTPNTSFVGTDSFTYYVTDLDKTSENVTVTIYVNTSVVSNITDSSDNTTTAGSNVTVNVSSDVYPLILNFQLYNGNTLVNESNFTANSSLYLPTNYSVPTGLAAGNYTLNLSLYSSTNELLNRTILSEFEIKSTGGSGDNNDGNTGGGSGGGSSRRTQNTTQNVTVNATIPSTNTGANTTVNNSTTEEESVTEEQPNFVNRLTGAVIGTNAGRWSFGILIFLILVGLAYWFVARKKKSVKVTKLSLKKKK